MVWMDVKLMAKTLQALGEFDGKSNLNLPQGHRRRQDAALANEIRQLSLLGCVFKLMSMLIIGTTSPYDAPASEHIGIQEYLIATVPHLHFFLFRTSRTRFLPAQNYYHNW
jgi:hypothetical protein